MAIFGLSRATESNFTADESMNVSEACMKDMLESFHKEIYVATAATYIADIRMEEAVSEGANVQGVMEGVIGGFYDKIVAAFRKIGDKIKGWFKAFRRWLDLIFKHGKDFITRFKDELHAKSSTGFEYSSFKYNQGAGDTMAKTKTDALSKKIEELCMDMKTEAAKEAKEWESKMADKDKFEDDYKTSKGSEEIFKDKSKMVEDLKKAYRGGAEEKSDLKDFEGTSKGAMMTFISESRETIKAVTTAESTLTGDINEIISAIEKSKDQFDKEDQAAKKGNVQRFITHTVSLLRDCVSMQTTVNEVRKSIYGEMASEFEKTLKAYLRYKPAKTEAFTQLADDKSMDSLLESSMKLV
jgi:hypothetical protein